MSEITTRPSHLRVDVSGVAIYVRSEGEYQHLEHINRKLAVAKLALHKICAGQSSPAGIAGQAIEDMAGAAILRLTRKEPK